MTDESSFNIGKFNFKKPYLSMIFLIVVMLSAFFLFGTTGLKTFLGFFIFLILPTYLVLKVYVKDEMERVFFSSFLSLLVTSLVIWYVDRIFHNLWISIIITAVLLYGLAYYLNKLKNNNK